MPSTLSVWDIIDAEASVHFKKEQQHALPVRRYEEDVTWMATHLQGLLPFVVYNTKDSTANHYTPVQNGNEAAAYLQFIVDYYDCLPASMAFIHAHQRDMKVAPDFAMV